MSGSARFTAEMSRMTISWATKSTPSRAGRELLLLRLLLGAWGRRYIWTPFRNSDSSVWV